MTSKRSNSEPTWPVKGQKITTLHLKVTSRRSIFTRCILQGTYIHSTWPFNLPLKFRKLEQQGKWEVESHQYLEQLDCFTENQTLSKSSNRSWNTLRSWTRSCVSNTWWIQENHVTTRRTCRLAYTIGKCGCWRLSQRCSMPDKAKSRSRTNCKEAWTCLQKYFNASKQCRFITQ